MTRVKGSPMADASEPVSAAAPDPVLAPADRRRGHALHQGRIPPSQRCGVLPRQRRRRRRLAAGRLPVYRYPRAPPRRGRRHRPRLRPSRKLVTLAAEHPHWSYTGVDFGANLAWCRANHPFGEWIDADLEKTEQLQLDPALLRSAVVVCSDVIEHLLDPLPLLTLTRNLLADGCRTAVFSTPAREFRSGYDTPGPPRNPSHVREWACDEFQALLRHQGFEIHYAGLTRSDDASNGLSTQLVTVGLPVVRRRAPRATPGAAACAWSTCPHAPRMPASCTEQGSTR